MDTLKVIDADTHVLETEGTWDYLLPSEQDWRPAAEAPKVLDPRAWLTALSAEIDKAIGKV